MHIEKASSGVAKAGLVTGIIGSSLGALNTLGGGLNLVGGMTREVCDNPHGKLVTRFEMEQEAKIANLETQIALRDANTFTDQKQLETYKYVDGRLREIEKQLCVQEIQNQKTADSFQILNERLQCCCNSLEEKICNEKTERKCADNAIVNYTNATFYPKQVANVTTGTTTTAQVTYNPLPVQSCSCSCN